MIALTLGAFWMMCFAMMVAWDHVMDGSIADHSKEIRERLAKLKDLELLDEMDRLRTRPDREFRKLHPLYMEELQRRKNLHSTKSQIF
jgi:hypothetical protein